MSKREPFDPSNPYDIGCDVVRRAILRTVSNTLGRMPPGLSDQEKVAAQVHGATMALACLMTSCAQPGYELAAFRGLMETLPQMIEDAKKQRSRALTEAKEDRT